MTVGIPYRLQSSTVACLNVGVTMYCGSGQNGDARSLRIKDRTGSDLSLIAQLRPHGLDRLSRPWIGEGELDSGHTTRHQGLCHIDCGRQIIQANDGDNSMLMQ